MPTKLTVIMALIGAILMTGGVLASVGWLFAIGFLLALPGVIKLMTADFEARQHLAQQHANARYFRNKARSRR